MIYRNKSGFSNISAITFGGASLSGEGGGYGFGEMSESDAETLIKGAWELGITVFDTAPIYGFGLSEERLGKYLPKEALIVSKSGVDWHESKRVNMTNDVAVTQKMLEQSLKRLQRDKIDIYMIHWPDPRVDIRKPMEVLENAKRKGLITHIGLSNTNYDDLMKATEVLEIEVIQGELNAFNQSTFSDLQNLWQPKLSMGWGTFDKGILSGRVVEGRKYDASDARSWAPWWNKKEVSKKIVATEKLKRILDDYNLSLPQFALSFSLDFFGIDTCLIGFKSVSDIVQVTSNLQQKLSRERIEEVLLRWKNP